MWIGVLLAAALCLGLGIFINETTGEFPQKEQELFEGIVAVIAVVILTWMVFWMRKVSRNVKVQLEQAVDSALQRGNHHGWALVMMVFFAVAREGLESVFFLLAAFQQDVGIWPPLGAMLGLATAVVTGAVVMAIGLNLAPIAVKSVSASAFDSWMAVMTVLCIGLVAVFTRGMIQRLLILVGLIVACLLYGVMTNVLGLGKAVDFTLVSHAAWFGLPHFSTPAFNGQAMMLIAPVAVILVAENLGHLKAVAGMTGRNMDPYMGRAFVGDGLATMLSGSVGGSGVTTYAENIGVMAVTKVYSTLVFVAAAVIAMLLGFSPKFGALIHTIPAAVIGGASIVVFGLIAVAGARIWVQNRVDLSQNGNLIMVAVTLVLGAGDFALTLGGFTLGGIGTATFGAILLNALLSRKLVDVPPPEVVHQEP